MYVFSMLSLGCVLLPYLVFANLSMHLLSGMIPLYLAAPFYTDSCSEGVFARDGYVTSICVTLSTHTTVYVEIFKWLNFQKKSAVSNFENIIFENGARV